MEVTQWDSVYDMYKLSLVQFFYSIACDKPYLIQNVVTWREIPYNLRRNNKAVVARFSTNFIKHSIHYRGAVLWNFFSDHFNNSCNFKHFSSKLKRDPVFKELNFNSLPVQSVPKRLFKF